MLHRPEAQARRAKPKAEGDPGQFQYNDTSTGAELFHHRQKSQQRYPKGLRLQNQSAPALFAHHHDRSFGSRSLLRRGPRDLPKTKQQGFRGEVNYAGHLQPGAALAANRHHPWPTDKAAAATVTWSMVRAMAHPEHYWDMACKIE